MTENTFWIGEISTELLRHYVDMRCKIDEEASAIESITSLLSLFETCGDSTIKVDPIALGKIHKNLNNNILNIWEALDGFIYVIQAQSELEKQTLPT